MDHRKSQSRADFKNPCLPRETRGLSLASSRETRGFSLASSRETRGLSLASPLSQHPRMPWIAHIYTLQHSTQDHLGSLPGFGTQTKPLREGSSLARAEMVLTHLKRTSMVPSTELGSQEALINVCTENTLLGPNDPTSLTEPDTNLRFNLHSLKS